MKFWSIFFGCFWAGLGVLALIGIELPTMCMVGACFLAAAFNFENI